MPRLFAALFAAAALAAPASAQDPKAVTVRWFGQSFFQIETSDKRTVVIDPHAIPQFGRPNVSADVVLISHPHSDHGQVGVLANAKDKPRTFEGVTVAKNGRTEWNRVNEKLLQTTVRSLGTYHDAVGGMQRGKNSVWVVEADGLRFVHLGDLGHELTPEQVKAVGPVDVLMVPVGGIYTLNGEQAKAVVAQLKPTRYVLPMHYGVPVYDDLLGPDEFLDGQKKVEKKPTTNELVIPVDAPAPADGPTVVLLGWEKAALIPPKK